MISCANHVTCTSSAAAVAAACDPGSTCSCGRARAVADGAGTDKAVLSNCWAWFAGRDAAGSCRLGAHGRGYSTTRAGSPLSNRGRNCARGSCWCPGSRGDC